MHYQYQEQKGFEDDTTRGKLWLWVSSTYFISIINSAPVVYLIPPSIQFVGVINNKNDWLTDKSNK